MRPLVSIVIPARNAADTIAACIASCRAQTHPWREIVLVDNGSTDDTVVRAEVAARGERLRVVQCEIRGSGPARNAGFAVAEGDAVVFLDADDEIHPRKLERQLGCLEDRGLLGAAAGVGSDFVLWDRLNGQDVRLAMPQPLRDDRLFDVLRGAQWTPSGAYLFTRAAADRLAARGGFSAAARLQDREYVACAILHGIVLEHVPELLYRYRVWSTRQASYSGPRHRYAPIQQAIFARVRDEAARVGHALSPATHTLLTCDHRVFRWRALRARRHQVAGVFVDLPSGASRPLDFYEAAVWSATRGPAPFFPTMAADRVVVADPVLDDRYLELAAAVSRLAAAELLEPVALDDDAEPGASRV